MLEVVAAATAGEIFLFGIMFGNIFGPPAALV